MITYLRHHRTYRHVATIDIDIYVLKVQYRGHKYTKCKVSIFNRHNDVVYETVTVTIDNDQLQFWEEVI